MWWVLLYISRKWGAWQLHWSVRRSMTRLTIYLFGVADPCIMTNFLTIMTCYYKLDTGYTLLDEVYLHNQDMSEHWAEWPIFSWFPCLWRVRTLSAVVRVMSERCFLAASSALHLVMAVSKVRFCCYRRCSMVSPSRTPSMTWSLIDFSIHAGEQKLHVLTSSHRASKKSSKASPHCCTRLQNYAILQTH